MHCIPSTFILSGAASSPISVAHLLLDPIMKVLFVNHGGFMVMGSGVENLRWEQESGGTHMPQALLLWFTPVWR